MGEDEAALLSFRIMSVFGRGKVPDEAKLLKFPVTFSPKLLGLTEFRKFAILL
jgi:hypothetical protein